MQVFVLVLVRRVCVRVRVQVLEDLVVAEDTSVEVEVSEVEFIGVGTFGVDDGVEVSVIVTGAGDGAGDMFMVHFHLCFVVLKKKEEDRHVKCSCECCKGLLYKKGVVKKFVNYF